MEDTIKSTSELGLRFGFGSNDDRLITIPNPRPDLTANEIKVVGNKFANANALIGDKNGDSCTGIVEAYVKDKTKSIFDL